MKKILLTFAVLALAAGTFAQVPSYVSKDSLIGWYNLNGNANNAYGPLKNGNAINFVAAADRKNTPGACLAINDSLTAITIDSVSNFMANHSGVSMSVWVYSQDSTPAYPGYRGIGGIRNHVDADFYMIQLSGNYLEARYSSTTGYCGSDISSFKSFHWDHYVLVKNNDKIYTYQNGELVKSAICLNETFHTLNLPFYIGTAPYDNDKFYFKGKLDDLGIWNKALSLGEIQALYSEIPTGVANLHTLEGLQVYPNPANTILNIDTREMKSPSDLSIFNALGELVFSAKLESKSQLISIEMLPMGVYTLQISNNGQSYTQRLLKL